MKNIISITGSTSEFGKKLVKILEKKKYYLNLSTRQIKPILKLKRKKIFIGNLKNRGFVKDLIRSTNCLINLSYNNYNHKENLKIIKNIVSVANNSLTIKKIIHISTAIVSSNNEIDKVSESTKITNTNKYKENKYLIEKILQDNLSKSIDLIILRPTEISNFQNKKSTIYSLKEKCLHHNLSNKILHFFLGIRILNYVSIDNVTSAIIFFMNKNKILRQNNIFFVSEDKENKNFNYYSKFLSNKYYYSKKYLKNIIYRKLLKIFFVKILKKDNPFQIYSNSKLKNFGFRFKYDIKKQLIKL